MLYEWPKNSGLPVSAVVGYSDYRESLAGTNPPDQPDPAYYKLDFKGAQRYVHAVTILGHDVDSYQNSRNWVVYGTFNLTDTQYGAWTTNLDDFGKEVPVGAVLESLRIERTDGANLALFWVGIFSTVSNCSTAFTWTTTANYKIVDTNPVSKAQFAKLGDCPIAHVVTMSDGSALPSYITYDQGTQQLKVEAPSNANMLV